MGRRLGGPTNPVCNYMMQASREQRKLVFDPGCQSANMNTLGPGPAIYSDMGLKPILYGSRDKHTIGRVSVPISSFLSSYMILFNLITGKEEPRPEGRRNQGANIVCISRAAFQINNEAGLKGYNWFIQVALQRDSNGSIICKNLVKGHYILLSVMVESITASLF